MDQIVFEDVSEKKKQVMRQLNIETYKGPERFEVEYVLRPNNQHDTTQKGSAHRVFAESNKLKNGTIMPLKYEYHIRSELPRIPERPNIKSK